MSPIVYMPPKKHDCEPPGQGKVYSSSVSRYLYPEGTIWECDECGSDWELDYDWYPPRLALDALKGLSDGKVIWNRLDD